MISVLFYLFNRFFYRLFVFLRAHSPAQENFNNLKLSMNVWQRLLVRLISYVIYGLLIVLAAIWLPSETVWMRVIGIIVAVFLIDRLWWFKKESVASWLIVEHALDRASLFGGDLYLWVAERSLSNKKVQAFLKSKSINAAELEVKIKSQLKADSPYKHTSEELTVLADQLINNNGPLTPDELFRRLLDYSPHVKMLVSGPR